MTQPSALALDVLFLVPGGVDAKGGIGRLALYLDREFGAAATDVRLRVVATRWTERPVLKHLTSLPALAAFAWRCAAGTAKIVHVNVAPRGSTYRKFLFWSVARLFGARTVLHLHGSGYDQYFEGERPFVQRRIRRFFLTADRVVVLGRYWRDFVVGRLGVAEDRVSIVSNGVPEPRAGGQARTSPPLIVSMGLVGERKGTDVLIAALAALPPSLDWRAVVGGDGEVEKYRAMAQAAGLGDRISFAGWLGEEEVDRWLGRASIFVLPSRAENQPVAILEAMARGLPVVATRIGAIPEQVVDGETGLLVPPGEVEPLRMALEELIGSDAKRNALGNAGRERFRALFSIAHCAGALRTLYRSLASPEVEDRGQ